MKRITLILAGLLLCIGKVAFAGLQEADALFTQGKYAEALAEYQNTLPTLTEADASYAQFYIAFCLEKQGRYDEAIAEYSKVATIQNANPKWVAYAQFHIGCCLALQGKYNEAITEYGKVATIQNAPLYNILEAQFYTGLCLEKQGKDDEAQQYYIAICKQENAGLGWWKRGFSKVNKTKLGKDGYVKLLQDIILIIPATDETAEFLGLLKSELQKLE